MSPSPLPPASEFIRERQYLKNVTTKTLAWYSDAFRAFDGCHTEQQYKGRIIELRQRGIAETSVNSWLRVVNAYLRWSKADYRLPKLQEPKKILSTLSPSQVSMLVGSKQKSLNNRR